MKMGDTHVYEEIVNRLLKIHNLDLKKFIEKKYWVGYTTGSGFAFKPKPE